MLETSGETGKNPLIIYSGKRTHERSYKEDRDPDGRGVVAALGRRRGLRCQSTDETYVALRLSCDSGSMSRGVFEKRVGRRSIAERGLGAPQEALTRTSTNSNGMTGGTTMADQDRAGISWDGGIGIRTWKQCKKLNVEFR